ncbi:unnamed protein product [Paramecium pentaurelia]|uniref:Uncharacterized protein n=1 Tax=Paramecium pentaurelia TaxID=43138 RepID=A0A8S1VY12_9CILI|nr:unnamed protein product [Paramecium pentaurelia]
MNSLIKKYFNQIAYGNLEAPLTNPERVLEVGNLINKKIRQLSKECNQLNIRVLEIRLQKQTLILDNYIQNPEYLNTKHNNDYMFYSFNNISMEQKQFIKIQDILSRKKKQQSELQIQQQEQRKQKQEKQIEVTNLKQINNQKSVEKKIELEKLISEVYSLLNEEEPKPLPKPNFKLNDLTKNLCPIVQYQRVKQLAQKLRGSQQRDVLCQLCLQPKKYDQYQFQINQISDQKWNYDNIQQCKNQFKVFCKLQLFSYNIQFKRYRKFTHTFSRFKNNFGYTWKFNYKNEQKSGPTLQYLTDGQGINNQVSYQSKFFQFTFAEHNFAIQSETPNGELQIFMIQDQVYQLCDVQPIYSVISFLIYKLQE